MIMNKKGGIVSFVFLLIMFNIIWFIWLGGWLTEVGEIAILTNSYTGLYAFFYSNLNLLLGISQVLGILVFSIVGDR